MSGFVDVPVDADSVWWWDALAAHRLVVPACSNCGRTFFPPQPTCPHCGSQEWTQRECSGRATVYSWIDIHVALHPAFAHDVPYTIVAAELDEGVRLFGRLRDATEVGAGEALEACFYEVEGRTLLGFRPAA
jgi:uncharacterized protein